MVVQAVAAGAGAVATAAHLQAMLLPIRLVAVLMSYPCMSKLAHCAHALL